MSSAIVACLPPHHFSSYLLCMFEVMFGVVSVKSRPVLESVCFCTNIHYTSAFFILLVW